MNLFKLILFLSPVIFVMLNCENSSYTIKKENNDSYYRQQRALLDSVKLEKEKSKVKEDSIYKHEHDSIIEGYNDFSDKISEMEGWSDAFLAKLGGNSILFTLDTALVGISYVKGSIDKHAFSINRITYKKKCIQYIEKAYKWAEKNENVKMEFWKEIGSVQGYFLSIREPRSVWSGNQYKTIQDKTIFDYSSSKINFFFKGLDDGSCKLTIGGVLVGGIEEIKNLLDRLDRVNIFKKKYDKVDELFN